MALVPLSLLSLGHQIICHLSMPTYLFALDLPNTGRLPQFLFPWEPALEFCSLSPSLSCAVASGVEWDFESSVPWQKEHRLWSKSDLAQNSASDIISHMPLGEFLNVSENFLISLNLSFCFCKMRINPAHRVAVRNGRDEKCWVSNSEWIKPKKWLVWLGSKGQAEPTMPGSTPPTSNKVTYALGTAGTAPGVQILLGAQENGF